MGRARHGADDDVVEPEAGLRLLRPHLLREADIAEAAELVDGGAGGDAGRTGNWDDGIVLMRAGDVLRVEKLAAEAGETVQFNEILMVGDQIGAPTVAGAAVQATVIDQIKAEKVINFVRRRRKHSSKRTRGHRQKLTLVRITEILATGGEATGVKPAVGKLPVAAE
jgi:large subunit ribosomal protein L21